MKLWYDRKSKDPTYFVQKGYRNGKKTTTKNIAKIGKHSELLMITDDPLAYAKEQVARYNEEEKNGKVSMEVKIDFNEKIKISDDLVSSSTVLNIGYLYLQQLYHDLAVSAFWDKAIQGTKITFDPNQINRFLIFLRILEPGSKLDALRRLGHYYEQPQFQHQHILRTMDILAEHFDGYIEYLFDNSCNVVKRNTSVCYYDCTNYYFEIESPDDDYVDEVTGESIKGFRKYGVCKQHQPAPLVEMGLFMDSDGIPLSMCLTSGSDNEQTTAIPAEKKLASMLKGKRFIYCADAGLGSYDIRNFNSMGGRSFIITQSIKKMSEPLQQAVLNDYDFKLLSSDTPVTIEHMKSFNKKDPENKKLYLDKAYKIVTADKAIDLGLYEEKVFKNGNTRMVKSKGILKQKIIITFSRKSMEYQRFIRNRQIERARKLLVNLDPETYKKGPNDVTRFIKRTSVGKDSEKATDLYEINEALIAEEEKYDGFYAIATNLTDDAAEIIRISSGRYKIEECFRILKTDFSSRPVFHYTKQRIIAHFMICYTALLIYRLLEKKLDDLGVHFTVNNIKDTLLNMNVVNLEDMCYMSTYTCSQVCTALSAAFDLRLDKKYYQPKELNKKIKKIT